MCTFFRFKNMGLSLYCLLSPYGIFLHVPFRSIILSFSLSSSFSLNHSCIPIFLSHSLIVSYLTLSHILLSHPFLFYLIYAISSNIISSQHSTLLILLSLISGQQIRALSMILDHQMKTNPNFKIMVFFPTARQTGR